MKSLRLIVVALFFFASGVATGAGLLLKSTLPLQAIEIDMHNRTFRFKAPS